MKFSFFHFIFFIGFIFLQPFTSISQVISPPIIFKKPITYSGEENPKPVWNFFLFGSGALRNSITDNTDNENPLNGSIAFGASNIYDNLVVGFTINDIESKTIDTPEAFGNALVIPEIGGQSFSIEYSHFFASRNRALERKIGIKTKGVMGLTNWTISGEIFDAIPLLFQVLLSYQPFPDMEEFNNSTTNKLDLSFDIGPTTRTLLGGVTERENLLFDNFGSKKRNFVGLHVGANFTINNLTVFSNFMQFFQNEKIEGLPKSELVVGAVLSGNLIQLK